MDKPTYKLVGSPCGHHGQYTFYKALRHTAFGNERIIALGDFFFVKIWQDSELLSIGEMQLLWNDRASDQTLVSLRLYFLPENTPDGRTAQHGEHEVLAINEKVVIRVDDLMTWLCEGNEWNWGLKAIWRGDCTPSSTFDDTSQHHNDTALTSSKLDFSDVDKEKSLIDDTTNCGVVVFSYPRYCRYRAIVRRLEGLHSNWLRDSLIAALGGYAASNQNTKILYCKETFEYPELEGHEFVCSELAPKLKGRPRARRRRAASPASPVSATSPLSHTTRSRSPSESSDVSTPQKKDDKGNPRSLQRKPSGDDVLDPSADKSFMYQLKMFYKQHNPSINISFIKRDLNLRGLYKAVQKCGGYDAACRQKAWLQFNHVPSPKRCYEKYLLQYEKHERKNGGKINNHDKLRNGTSSPTNGKNSIDQTPVATIDISDSPPKEIIDKIEEKPIRNLRTPSPGQLNIDETSMTNEIEYNNEKLENNCNTTNIITEKKDLNQEFLDSLPKDNIDKKRDDKPLIKISVKPVEKLIEPKVLEAEGLSILISDANKGILKSNFMDETNPLFAEIARAQHELLVNAEKVNYMTGYNGQISNGDACGQQTVDGQNSTSPPRPVTKSSLRSVRVKPTRHNNTAPATPSQPDSASSSPPSQPPVTTTPSITNFGINYPVTVNTTLANNNNMNSSKLSDNSDDEIVEVPYKPKTPEIIDLDAYESPDSPQSGKRKRLDILKERGLEVTPLPADIQPVLPTPPITLITPNAAILNPVIQHQIMNQALSFSMYSSFVPVMNANGMSPPKVIQGNSIYGTSGPEKTVYGNPKDPFMPPPHILGGTPMKPAKTINIPATVSTPGPDILDLTCKTGPLTIKPAVEIVRIPSVTTVKPATPGRTNHHDGKSSVGSNLEITLVNRKPSITPPKPTSRLPQKRSLTGKFLSTKTSISSDTSKYSPALITTSSQKTTPNTSPRVTDTYKSSKNANLVIPNYQISNRESASPSSSSRDTNNIAALSNLLQNPFLQKNQNLAQMMVDPLYMTALYSSIASGMGPSVTDQQQQLDMYRELISRRILSGYPGLLNTPTTKS